MYEALDKSQEDYTNLFDEATIEAKGDYLEETLKLYSVAQVTYSQTCNNKEKAKALEGFEVAKNKVVSGMQIFRDSCEVLTMLISGKNISFANLRTELAKIEDQHEKLRVEKADVELRFSSAEDRELDARFLELVGAKLRRGKEDGLTYLQAEVTGIGLG